MRLEDERRPDNREIRLEVDEGVCAGSEYLHGDDAFYWMSGDRPERIPLEALRLELPLGCRFCI